MIIVDAMQFAFLHPTGATLCFITGDVDYAYTLAVLQRPCWRTIVISKGTISSMLHVNCDMRMRWETDILQLRPQQLLLQSNSNNKQESNPRHRTTTTLTSDVEVDEPTQSAARQAQVGTVVSPPQVRPRRRHQVQDDSEDQNDDDDNDDDDENDDSTIPTSGGNGNDQLMTPLQPPTNTIRISSAKTNNNHSSGGPQHRRFEPLSPIEEWTDDVELLRSLLKANGNVGFKCTVGNLLRTTNPARFSNRLAVRNFLAESIDAGVVVESGEGNYKELSLPYATSKDTQQQQQQQQQQQPSISVSKSIPLEMLEAVPDRVVEVSARRPYILFAPKMLFAGGIAKPKGAFVKDSKGRWLILMFLSFLDVQKAVEEQPELTDCTLVDWRNCQSLDGHPRDPHAAKRTRETPPPRRRSAPSRHRTRRSGRSCCRCHSSQPHGPQQSDQADRLLPFPRNHRGRQDRVGQSPRRIPLR